jgi:glycosyltransferase involved in cell wall biosynthesis
MKRILHSIAQVPGKTGSGIFLQALLRESNKKGYNQALIAGIPQEQKNYNFNDIDNLSFYPVVFETKELSFPVVGMSDVMPYKSTRYSDLTEEMFLKWKEAFSEAIIQAVREFKPDYIISHHLWILSALIKEIAPEIPMVSICHGTDIRQLKLARKFANNVIEGCKNIEVALALSEYQKESIIENYGFNEKDIIVIGGGFDEDIFYPSNNTKNDKVIRLVYAGKLSYSKGVSSLIKACKELEFDKCRIELVIAGSGSGEEEKAIRTIATNSHIPVTFCGNVSQRELANIFRQSDIFILPSFYEGLSLVLIEALACGLRVVSTDLPGLRKWLGEEINSSGIIEFVKLPPLIGVDVPDLDELPDFEMRLKSSIEKQLKEVINNSIINHKAIQESIRRMSWEGIFEKIEECFDKIDRKNI